MPSPLHPNLPHFTWPEVADPSRPLLDSLVHLCLESSDRFWKHMELLELLRRQSNLPIRVTSGYRTPTHNDKVGGAPKSQHMIFATDIQPQGYPENAAISSWWQQAAVDVGFKGIGFYPAHIHLDLRNGSLVVWDER